MLSQSASAFLVCLALLPSCHGQGFLHQKPETASIQAELKGVLSEALGQGHGVSESRLARIRAAVQPLFRSLPKNNKGHLSGPLMRYAVRRYFSQEHAWTVKGFEPHAEHINISESSGDILQGKVPSYIRAVFEEKFNHHGFAFEDLVAMVAAIERLAFDEVVRSVESSFWLNDKSVTDALSQTEMMEVLSSHLITSMFGGASDKEQHLFDKKYINVRYPHWSTTILFLTDIAGSDTFQRSGSANPFVEEQKFFFNDLIRMAERVSEEFGPWSNHECHEMKELLVERDTLGFGRVKLADFYRKTEDGAWQFTEQSEYLRQLGALDESSSSLGPQVLIPNYVTGMSNCITSGPYYSVCCLNECNHIYRNLEALIPAPTASPAELLKAIESMPQALNITAPLRAKLEEVAQTHNGNIPVHGRLVAQWLHFAFPYECPYPHEAGTISPKLPDQWRAERGDEADGVSEDEVKQVVEMDARFQSASADEVLVSWTPTESLLMASTPSDETDNHWQAQLRIFMQVSMVISCVAVVLRQLSQVITPGNGKKIEYDV